HGYDCHISAKTGVFLSKALDDRRNPMSATARLPQADLSGPFGRLAEASARRMLGDDEPTALGVMWHSPAMLRHTSMFGRKAKKKWRHAPPDLKALAHMAAAATIGCSMCLDFGYYQAQHEVDIDKARQVPRWRSSTVFTPLERRVLAYAEAMCQTPPTVTDEMVAELLEELGAPAVLELTAWIGFANMTARTGVTLGLESHGLSARCGLPPLAEPDRREVGSA